VKDALFIFVILFAMGFCMVFEFLARPIAPEVAVTTPLAVLITVPPKPTIVRRKPRVVVVPVVVGAAACPELNDGAPCREIYDFRQRCSASWPKEKPHS
jgi:hypothetical protein